MAVKGVANIVPASCKLADVLHNAKKSVPSFAAGFRCFLKNSQLQLGRNMMVFYCQNITEVNMVLLFDQSIGVNKPFKVNNKNIRQFLEQKFLMRFNSLSVQLITLDLVDFKEVI